MPGISFDFRNDRLLALNASYAALAADLGVAFLDIATPLSESASYLKSQSAGDQMHCSAAGYSEIASIVDMWPAWREIVHRDG